MRPSLPKTRVFATLWQGARAIFFLRPQPMRIGGDVPTLCGVFLADAAVSIVLAWLAVAMRGQFNWSAWATLFSQVPFLLLASWVAARRSLKGIEALSFASLALGVGPSMALLGFAALWLGSDSEPVMAWTYPVLIVWWVLVLSTAYVRLVGRGFARSGAGLTWIFAAAFSLLLPQPSLVLPVRDESQTPPYRPSIEREDAFHAQAGLFEAAVAQLKPQRPGVEDLYFVGFAGYASEDVFYKELRVIAPLMDERFDTAGRSLVLVNNPQTATVLPVATATNLRAALRAVGGRINRDEDVVVLYLTSHGASTHEFAVQFAPLALDDITPATLKTMLDEAGIKWRVIVVSACYAGGYIHPLKDEQTLVMTAADATHTSFGCGSASDFTYFGQALFDQELRRGHSFPEAFGRAKASIRQREIAQGYEPSNPQIALGSLMADKLARIAARLDARSPSGSH